MRMSNKIGTNIGVDKLIEESGPYVSWALQQRKEFMELRLDQEQEIREIYENMSKRISLQVAEGNLNTFDQARLRRIQQEMKTRIDDLNGQLTINFDNYIKRNIQAGSGYSKKITLNLIDRASITRVSKSIVKDTFYRMNIDSAEAMWSRSRYGLKLSDQIWNKNQNYRKSINNILTSGVASGEDCLTVARGIENYVKKGKKSFAKDYPNMMARMPGRIPEDISYEALRLARTEMTSAYGMGTTKAAHLNPATKGIKYILSASHPKYDICDPITMADDYGLGPGGYPLDKAPLYPFHPNCLCIMTTINEDPEELVARLRAWEQNPSSQPDLERWYQENYAA
ncbi:hypothetical protein [Alkaliphilus metalliredigens]|nr:hypothetical protein [Alkaliphilus metalliredigens]